ncbi:alpha/beta hydrolase family protein [Bhargavaea cecembensis]|uniref:alpha/beta hydrolase family protein n=1 Tax=Bhargavaea cecembensis TaxID=394098 RepID=UPI000A6F4C86|nr:lysophospholipase [Bhargavaea cecembensis]
MLVGSLLASHFNRSGGDVDVSRVYFETPSGELSGLLYKPDGADGEPRPTIIATHGYLNSAEMQDAQAIEMSKRGYVVLALDLYDHGHSTNTAEKEVEFFSFWPQTMYDAVQYMYDQDFVLKDEAGNGIIAVSGHSMGGFSSTHAVMLDEKDVAENGFRKIYSSLTFGSDYWWLTTMGYTPEQINAAYAGRPTGKIAGRYDEFFFDRDAELASRTVVEKDYVNTEEGSGFLGNPENPQAGVLYEVDGGKRVIYQPNETHPWNHFSKTATGDAIDFYDAAFQDYSGLVTIGEDGQTWMYKEYASFIALIGFFLFFMPFILLLSKLPFFKGIRTPQPRITATPKSAGAKAANYALLIFGGLFPALFFTALYSGDPSGVRILTQASLVLAFTFAVVLIVGFVKGQERDIRSWALIMLVLSVIQLVLLKNQETLIAVNSFFGAPTVNPILYWAVNVSIVLLMLLISSHYLMKKPDGATIAGYGVKASVKTVVAALGTAVIAVAAGYGILYAVDAVFKTDFRLWTVAVKTFEPQHLVALLKYAPLFLIYYFIVGVSVNMNTSGEKFNGFKGYVAAILHFVGGLILYLIYQYGLLFATGTAGYPSESLSSIIVIGLVPVLSVAAVFNLFLYRRTGNVYTGAFLNAVLMTLITLANTALYTVL